MSQVRELHSDVPERTMQRAIQLGLVRGRRIGPRRFTADTGETEYLQRHWGYLAQLRKILGAKPVVRMAVLYGSMARGDDVPESDIDLLIQFREPQSWLEITALTIQLEQQLDRSVDIADFESVTCSTPLLTLQAIDDGRVLVDKDKRWPAIIQSRSAIYARAQRAYLKELESITNNG